MRWCGTRARVSRDGFAVPMSIPRYTRAESTLTISTGKVSASCKAHSLFPTAVGPASTTTGTAVARRACSAPTQKELIELAEREACPGWPAVIALVGALGGLHLPKQGIHLRQRQSPVRMNRRAAGERAQETVSGFLQMIRPGLELQVPHHRADHFLRMLHGQQGGNPADREPGRPERIHLETCTLPVRTLRGQRIDLMGLELQDDGLD